MKKTYKMIFSIIGLVTMLPALVLVSGGILFSIFHSAKIANILNPDQLIFHPTVIIGGLIASILLNLSVMLKTEKLGRLNRYIVLGSFLLLGTIILYLIAENTKIFSFIY